jgi:hypothetical protein
MNNFQSDKNGAEVAAASDSNPVRVAPLRRPRSFINTRIAGFFLVCNEPLYR